jgi:hypothetical protein
MKPKKKQAKRMKKIRFWAAIVSGPIVASGFAVSLIKILYNFLTIARMGADK